MPIWKEERELGDLYIMKAGDHHRSWFRHKGVSIVIGRDELPYSDDYQEGLDDLKRKAMVWYDNNVSATPVKAKPPRLTFCGVRKTIWIIASVFAYACMSVYIADTLAYDILTAEQEFKMLSAIVVVLFLLANKRFAE